MRTPAHNANGHRRRQLTRRIKATATHCALCDGALFPDVKWPHDLSTVIDEDIPRVLGGDPLDPANTNPLHNICNRWKSTMTLSEARQLIALGAVVGKPLKRKQRTMLLNPTVGDWDQSAYYY